MAGVAGSVAGSAVRQPGSTAVNTAPPSWPTLIIPPRPSTICRTRARPSPRRAPVTEDLVVTPSVKICSRMSCGTPGPESRTRISRSASAATRVSSTSRGAGPCAAASMALSMRLPATVSTPVMSPMCCSTRLSGMIRSRTSRSPASDTLARMRAASFGSPIASINWSVSSPRAADTSVTNWIASPVCPSSTSPTRVCSRFANSWDCARSVSVSPMASSSSRLRLSDSVRSWNVTTQPTCWRLLLMGIRLAARMRSSCSTSRSLPVALPVTTSAIRPGGSISLIGAAEEVGRQGNQRSGGIVREQYPAALVVAEHGFPDAVQHRLALLEQARRSR